MSIHDQVGHALKQIKERNCIPCLCEVEIRGSMMGFSFKRMDVTTGKSSSDRGDVFTGFVDIIDMPNGSIVSLVVSSIYSTNDTTARDDFQVFSATLHAACDRPAAQMFLAEKRLHVKYDVIVPKDSDQASVTLLVHNGLHHLLKTLHKQFVMMLDSVTSALLAMACLAMFLEEIESGHEPPDSPQKAILDMINRMVGEDPLAGDGGQRKKEEEVI